LIISTFINVFTFGIYIYNHQYKKIAELGSFLRGRVDEVEKPAFLQFDFLSGLLSAFWSGVW